MADLVHTLGLTVLAILLLLVILVLVILGAVILVSGVMAIREKMHDARVERERRERK